MTVFAAQCEDFDFGFQVWLNRNWCGRIIKSVRQLLPNRQKPICRIGFAESTWMDMDIEFPVLENVKLFFSFGVIMGKC
jgi:hypothetical protein